MDEAGIREFLAEVGARNVKKENGWIMSSCLLAPWTHETGTDSSPSMGVSVHEDDKSIFNCFTCKKRGTLMHLLEQLEEYTGEDWSDLKEGFGIGEEFGAPLGGWARAKAQREEPEPPPLEAEYENLYEQPRGHPYARKRGVRNVTFRALGLQVDPDNRGVERILFPVRDRDGALRGFTGRACTEGVNPKVRDYHGLPKRSVLLGLHRVTSETERICITEGPFDWARLCQFFMTQYPQVVPVATLYSGLTNRQEALLKALSLPVVDFMDRDEAGRQGAVDMAQRLMTSVPFLTTTPWPKGPKDAATLTGTQARHLLKYAKLFALSRNASRR